MTQTPTSTVRYRDVLGVREFQALAASQSLSILGDQVARIAVALLVFSRTGSTFVASATYACSYLTWLVGGPFLTALSDRYARRKVMIVCDVIRSAAVALMATTPAVWAIFLLVVAVGLLSPPFDSARSAILPDVLTEEQFPAGNAIMNSLLQAGQAAGFLGGGVLVALSGVSGALIVDALTFLVSAAALRGFVRSYPSGGHPRRALAREAWEGLELVARTARLRRLLAWAAVSAMVIIPPEGLAVAVAARSGGGPVGAGVLTGAVPVGFLVGVLLLRRLGKAQRRPGMPGLLALSCLPLLATPLLHSTPAIAGVWVLSGAGSVLQLVANTRYVATAPRDVRARAYGVAVTVLMTVQGAALLTAGRLAEVVDPRIVVAGAGLLGLLCIPVLAGPAPDGTGVAQGNPGERRQLR